MNTQVEIVDKALCAIRSSKDPFEAAIAAVDAVVACSGVRFNDADLERLLYHLPTMRGTLEGFCPARAPLFDFGVTALKTLFALCCISLEGAVFDAYLDVEEPSGALVEKCAKVDSLREPLLKRTMADLRLFKSGLINEIDARAATRAGEAFERAYSKYMLTTADEELSRRSRARLAERFKAAAAREGAYYRELGELAASETLQ